MPITISPVVDVKTSLGENPLWDIEQQRLYFIDSADGRIFRTTADGYRVETWDVREMIGSMALRSGGETAVVALQSGIYSFDFKKDQLELLHAPEADTPTNRLNDGKADSRGRFVFGSMDTREAEGAGKLYRLDPDMSLTTLDEGIVCSNGPCWSPDERTFYFTDSWSGEIRAYDYEPETGSVSRRRTFVSVDERDGGLADGMTVDAEGFLWEAHVFAGKLNRYAPDGTLERSINMPVRKVTSVMFGGPNLDTLFVTSMGRSPKPQFPEDGPLRGAVFAVEGLGVRGLPAYRFGA
ncbi:SMP-30/gluconolactonase/LRE family protein [Paenarthrobacter sp. NPDC091669]|uniref:SMP-30/gluconolactonase/LRE family protein n=1 Tax=Paenarthrobacter sp. NPDC091669 TaxID=3364384 RepID=UPI00382035C9